MGIALLASGQAFADYFSRSNVTNFTDGTKWSNISCSGTVVGSTITPSPTSDMLFICDGTSLTPTAIMNAGALLFQATGTWGGGVLTLGAGNKIIASQNSSLAPMALNISSMTTGNVITIMMLPITFSSVTGGSLNCGGVAYTAGNAIAGGDNCTVTVVPVVAPPAVSAPIDFDFNKPTKVFTTEIKVK